MFLTILVGAFLTGSGCATPKVNKISAPTKTFAYISSQVFLEICEQRSPEDNPSCERRRLASGSASGVVIRHYRDPVTKEEKSLVLSAGHVCKPVKSAQFQLEQETSGPSEKTIPDKLPPTFPAPPTPLITSSVSRKIMIRDYAGNIYTDTKVIIFDMNSDLCLLEAERLAHSFVAKMSPRPPENGERVLNIAAPFGIIHYPGVLLEEGIYVGECEFPTCPTMRAAWYTDLNSGPGSSGSPIFLKINGQWMLVGIIHSVHRMFPSAPYAATLEQMRDFATINFNSYIERRRKIAAAIQD